MNSLRNRLVKVVGYDGSTDAPRLVQGAVRRIAPGDRLVMVHVLDRAGRSGSVASRHDDALHRIRNQLLTTLDPAVLDAIDYELRVVDGPVAPTLIEIALGTRADAIVIGTRRGPARLGQRTVRTELEDGPVPVVALYREAERESHPHAERVDSVDQHGHDSFPASDPPSSWSGPPAGIRE